MPRYRWNEPSPVPDWAYDLTADPLVSTVLYRRGIQDRASARQFLQPRLEDCPAPWSIPDLDRAVSLVEVARSSGRPVVVFGDYDVDGLTATSLLARVLREFGCEVIPVVPHRLRDGYGFSERHIPTVLAAQPGLLLTVDCGTGDWEALSAVRSAGIPVVVLDHHDVHRVDWPLDLAFVSVKRPDAPAVFRDLAAVGVAFQFARALAGDRVARRWLALVALGTVADVVPLLGINRILVATGLASFWETAPIGIQALARVAGLRPYESPVTSWHCGYMLGPRLNAAGRMDDPRIALELLLTDDPQRAELLAHRLSELNAARQRVIEQVLERAEAQLRSRGELPEVLVLADEAWHVGLVGLAASKLVSRYARPVVLLAQGGPVSRGSARSIDGFDISAALDRCRDLLLDHGGHSAAAGLTVPTERIAELEARLMELAREWFGGRGPAIPLDLDLELYLHEVSLRTAETLACLEPFGHGNPAPRCLVRDVRLADLWPTQNERHLRVRVIARDGTVRQAIWFEGASELQRLSRLERVDIAFTIRRDAWNGEERVQLDILDVRPAQPTE